MSNLVSQYDQFLSSLTEERRRDIVGHAYSFCKFNGELIPTHDGTTNLFHVVSEMECYIVDTNSNWKAESAKPENSEKAFILSKTVTDEQPDLRGLLFGPAVNIRNDNIFVLGVFHPPHPDIEQVIMLERLDCQYRGVFDEESLIAGSTPENRLTDPAFLEHQSELKVGVEHERSVILLLLGKLKDISELPHPEELESKREQLLENIQREAPNCPGDFLRSVAVARHCYALLLAERLKMRTEFAKPDYINVFGDTHIVQTALFMGARILSGDKPLKRMASYAGLECVNRI